MSREIRKVDINWEHPKDDTDRYKPLNSRDEEHKCNCEDCEINGDGYMPKFDSPNALQIYEGVSEGTPISPVFKNGDELVKWLMIEEDLTEEQAREFLKMEYVPSMVMVGGKMYRGFDSLKIKD
ncbi:MAG TPA: hypothetical protein ENI23_12410 [bacterium]|nr:hypothetical protein [bacterium]